MVREKKILKTPLRIGVILFLTGIVMRLMHWPNATEVLLFSFAAIALIYSIRFLYKSDKKLVDYVKLTLVSSWCANGVLEIFDFSYTIVLQIIIGISFVLWFFLEGTAYFLDEDRRAKNSTSRIVWNITMVIGVLAIVIGGLLKIIQWEYAVPLLATGIAIVSAYIIKDAFNNNTLNNEDNNTETSSA